MFVGVAHPIPTNSLQHSRALCGIIIKKLPEFVDYKFEQIYVLKLILPIYLSCFFSLHLVYHHSLSALL